MADHDHDHSHDDPNHSHDHDHAKDHTHDHAEHDHDHGGVATEEKPKIPIKVTVEEAGPARKALIIEVPEERIKVAVGDNYDKLKNDAVIPGFRRGRAPMRLLEKRFGSAVKDDVKGQVIAECYEQAIEEQSLEVLGEPSVKDIDKIELPESGSFTYRVEIEVVPQFELPSLEGIAIEKPTIAITDAMVQEETERLRERHGKLNPAPDSEAQEKDYVECEVRIMAGEKAPEPEPNAARPEVKEGEEAPLDPQIAHFPQTYVIVHGESKEFKGHVAGILVPDMGRRLLGKKAGEHVVISMTGPTGHENERVQDKPITIHLHVRNLHRPDPATTEQVLQQTGLETQEQLSEEIKRNLETRRDQQQRESMNEQISDYLTEKVQFELPAGLSRKQAARILQRTAMDLAYNGMPEAEIEQRIAELRTKSEDEARKQLKQFFVLDKASKQLGIDVQPDEINGRIAYMAVQQGRRPEKLRQEMIRNGQYEQFYFSVRDQKTMEAILTKATVTETTMTEEELKGGKRKKK